MSLCLYHDRETGWSACTGSIQDTLDNLREDGPVTIFSDSMASRDGAEIPRCRIIEGTCCGDEFTIISVD